MRPTETPTSWTDRKALLLDVLPEPLEPRVAKVTDEWLRPRTKTVCVVALDPGGTTGWAVLWLDVAKLTDKKYRAHECITRWWHGQVDCGSQSGNAADSATANAYDLGISETGEAAGVSILDSIIGFQIDRLGPVAVVIEDFILRSQSKSRDVLSPVRITGALQQLLWESRETTIYKQQPSEAKTTATDDRLQQWGLWDRSGGRHARDADRHAILFVRKIRENRSKIYAAWPHLSVAESRGLLEL